MNTRTTSKLVALAAATLLAVTGAGLGTASADSGATITGGVTSTNHRWLVNAVVWLEGVHGTFHPPAHPVELDQHGLQFVPKVLAVMRGTTVRFLNNDPTQHNVYSPEAHYDLGSFAGGAHADHVFAQQGVFTQLCHLHPAMMAFIVVTPSPYFAVTGADGTFHIANVPAGTYQLKAWQEHARGGPVSVTVPATGTVTAQIPLQRAAE